MKRTSRQMASMSPFGHKLVGQPRAPARALTGHTSRNRAQAVASLTISFFAAGTSHRGAPPITTLLVLCWAGGASS